MFWVLLALGFLLRLRFDVCVALIGFWLLALWLTTGSPSMLAMLQVLGGVGLLVVMYWAEFLRKEKP